jgi:hypothetical protein
VLGALASFFTKLSGKVQKQKSVFEPYPKKSRFSTQIYIEASRLKSLMSRTISGDSRTGHLRQAKMAEGRGIALRRNVLQVAFALKCRQDWQNVF